MAEKNWTLDQWLDTGRALIDKTPLHYVHKDKSGVTNWFFGTGVFV